LERLFFGKLSSVPLQITQVLKYDSVVVSGGLASGLGNLRRDLHDGAFARVISAVEGVFAVEAAIHVSNLFVGLEF